MLIEPRTPTTLPGPVADWRQRLDTVVDTMRDISRQTDPQAVVRTYASRMSTLANYDRTVSISRRGLQHPWYRITRSSTWNKSINPWKEAAKLPTFDSGLLGELIYSDEPRLINALNVSPDDPAAEYFDGMQSAIAVPHFDGGQALNMVVHMRKESTAFAPEDLPQLVLISSLFGRATQNLVLSEELREAYAAVDRELQAVADIQHSLLPAKLPTIPTLDLAAHYQTSRYAGGDYYDFFQLPGGRWGILIADVSGHGTPAAVFMAILHSIAHSLPHDPERPATMLRHTNERLTRQYTAGKGTFVTAFYGVYNPADRSLRYARAGHPPPRLRRACAETIESLDKADGLPLGIIEDAPYTEATVTLQPWDLLLLYTDGITEAHSPGGEMFGVERLDPILARCHPSARPPLDQILAAVETFTAGRAPDDDRTLLAAKVS